MSADIDVLIGKISAKGASVLQQVKALPETASESDKLSAMKLLRSTLASMANDFEAAADEAASKSDYVAAMLLYDKATLSFTDACESEAADRARAKLSEATRNDVNVRALQKNRASGRKLLHMAMSSHSQGNFSAALTLYTEAHGMFMLSGDDAGVAESTSGKMQCAIDEFEASVYSRTLDAVAMALATVDSPPVDEKWQLVDCELEDIIVEEKSNPDAGTDLDAAIDLPPVVRATCFIDAPAAVVMGDIWPLCNLNKWEPRVTEASLVQTIDANLEVVKTVKNVGLSMDLREFETARHRSSDGDRRILVEFSVDRLKSSK